ncbi:MAG: TonB-dependent receptor [Candidatus Eisenbacteria bacterium]|nr:TonB-dependent receptor [Candidatus Eisenbacteria bacterium]
MAKVRDYPRSPSTHESRARFFSRLFPRLVIPALLLLAGSDAYPQGVGRILGKVLDAGTGKPLGFANIVVLDTQLGAVSSEDGEYIIVGIPPGVYSVRASLIGYTGVVRKDVRVLADQAARANFELQQVAVGGRDEVVIWSTRPMVEVDVASTTRNISGEQLRVLPVGETVQDVLAMQAGIVSSKDEFHVRGGRTDEIVYIVDGVKMKDALSGGSSGDLIGARSVAEMSVITGGFSAKYGQALSGVVDVKVREGGPAYRGSITYATDHTPLFSYYNYDYVDFQFGGPEPLTAYLLPKLKAKIPGEITFFMNLSGDVSDTYLPDLNDMPARADDLSTMTVGPFRIPVYTDGEKPRLASSYKDKVLGTEFSYGSFFTPRSDNNWRAIGKLVWVPSPAHKFGVSLTKWIGIGQGFAEHDIGEVAKNITSYPWSWSRRLDHYYTITSDQNSFSAFWRQNISKSSYHNLQISRYFSASHRDVAAKTWSDYEQPDDSALPDSLDSVYFYDSGDASDWRDRYIETWGITWDLTKRFEPHHEFITGFDSQYENVQYISISRPWEYDPDGLGREHDLFHVYPNKGSLYAEDKLEYEGFIAKIGLRYDYWFPGEALERAVADTNNTNITSFTRANFYHDTKEVFGRRFKAHLSPRLAISHPITDRDNLFFNYGHFTQWPTYYYIYSKITSVSSESYPRIGNPNLNPEIAVQYELGARHQFTDDMAGDVTLFYKDIYDYPTATPFTLQAGIDPSTGQPLLTTFFIYRNVDYARSRGLELEFKKKRTNNLSFGLSYTFSIATGKSSDPNAAKLVQEAGGDFSEANLGEEYMWWNRPHKFTSWVDYRVPIDAPPAEWGRFKIPPGWSIYFYWYISSGEAYTPEDSEGRDSGEDYSRNGPFESQLSMKLTKVFKLRNNRLLEVVFQGWNILDRKNVTEVDPQTGAPYEPGVGTMTRYNTLYYLTQYSNPAYFGVPRNFRLAVSYEW